MASAMSLAAVLSVSSMEVDINSTSNGMVRSRGATYTAPTKDPLKPFVLVLGDTQYRIITEVEALESGVAENEELDHGDHPWVGDEVEEPSNVLFVQASRQWCPSSEKAAKGDVEVGGHPRDQ